MLESIGLPSLDALIDATLPLPIRINSLAALPRPRSESETLRTLKAILAKNRTTRSMIGMGYHPSILPAPIQRGVLENPGWYTQYTPYQAEIAQGRLQVLFYFQSMICDLTGMEVANASLLDEGTAAAEAVSLAFGVKGGAGRNKLLLDTGLHPQTLAVLQTRAEAIELTVDVVEGAGESTSPDVFAVVLQMPGTEGKVTSLSESIERVHRAGALAIVATDLLPLTLMSPPGEMGADIVVGSSQPFGVPLGYGGPHAAFFATRDKYKRRLPGRIVGLSKDRHGRSAFRLALQTREQHIRREKATSNICTAQALLANMAALYAMYHGPDGLRRIATEVHHRTVWLATQLRAHGCVLKHEQFFDTLMLELNADEKQRIIQASAQRGLSFRHQDIPGIGISLNETVLDEDLHDILGVFGIEPAPVPASWDSPIVDDSDLGLPESLRRTSPYLTHPTFSRYHSETEFTRFLKRLESRDLSLTTSMIPLGSCTMKLNAAMEMQALSWPSVSSLHPFCPKADARGYGQLIEELESWLAQITGFDAVSLQPNAGSQGEYAGLLAIKEYHRSRQQEGRRVCMIPRSAHGTNPASAVMAGFTVVPVNCDDQGNIDLNDLREKAAQHADSLGLLMITYPSTHGVFEEDILAVTELIHRFGGQVYLDGANLNAQVGLCTPASIGADVCHLNLHKTFCIPHGGGGPGVGPIAVRSHLAPHLPGHPLDPELAVRALGPVSAAPYGSASLLTISWAYLSAMGESGLTEATRVAILNANYIAHRLQDHFPIIYRGRGGFVAHECIVDLRAFKLVTVEDVAKRLMDYGFHAPTVSWPVAGTMMIEPTESESKEELDRFCDALIAIHGEIMGIESGALDADDNLLKNAPHTAEHIAASEWTHPYSREQAAFPLAFLREHKFWPAVGRIDNVFGDRNPVCTCQGMDAFVDQSVR